MKIQLVSDLHLEFNNIEPYNAGADILILSGDIIVADYLNKSEASPKFQRAQYFVQFFEQCSRLFEQVIYIPGNHEFYHGSWEHTVATLRAKLDFDNVAILDNNFIDYNGFRFIGTTLWTACPRPLDKAAIEQGLNDYRLIKKNYRRISAKDTSIAHYTSLRYIEANIVPNTIVVGHHAPSYRSVEEKYRTGPYSHLNHAYYSDLDNFILDYPDIRLWTHGHMHASHDYYIGTTRVVCNPHGYNDENPAFNFGTVIEI